jgi:adenylate cyclase
MSMAGVRFLRELRRRHVFRVAAGYAVVGWLLIQVATQVFPFFELPNWSVRLIVLVILAGFPIALVLAWAFDATPSGIGRTDGGASQSSHRGAIAVALVGILIAVLAGFVWWRWHTPAQETKSEAVSGKAVAEASRHPAENDSVPVPPKSIAVLPFVNMSGEAKNEYFSDGITEEILNALAQISGLKVAARTSAFAFKGKDQDLRKVGETLGVANVLEGSVQSAGDDVRITAQLIDARNGYHLWSEKYDRKLTNVFAVEDEISKAIADHLQITLDSAQPLVTQPTTDMRAHDLYLRALALMPMRGTALREAKGYLEQAVAIDPHFAKAWAALSSVHEMLPTYQLSDWASARQQAETAAQRVVAIAPQSAEAHAATATLVRDDLKFAEADAEYRKAIALNPGDAETHDKYAQLLGVMAAYDRSIEQGRIAASLNPLGMHAHYLLGYLFENAHRYDEAIAELRRALELAPDFADAHFDLAQVYIQTRDFKAAEEHLRRGAALAGEDPELAAALVRAVADPALRADAIRKLDEGGVCGRYDFYSGATALWYSLLGAHDKAVDSIERAIERAEPGELFWDLESLLAPGVDPIRDDARYKAALSRRGLPVGPIGANKE